MSKLSRTMLTVGIIGALALSAPLLASQFHGHAGDREARHGHHAHMMMAREHRAGEYHRQGRGHEHRAQMGDEERKAYREERRVRFMAMRMHWDSLSDEDRAAYKEQAREHMAERRAVWETMSPEERQAARERHRRWREHLQTLPEDEREALRERLRYMEPEERRRFMRQVLPGQGNGQD